MDENLQALRNAPPPENKTELLDRIDQAWTALQAALAGLSEAQLTAPGEGGWSTIDNLTHVEFWEQYMLRAYLGGESEHEAAGVDAATYRTLDTDSLNAIVYRRNQGRPPGGVRADLQRTHEKIMSTLEAMPWADLTRQLYPEDPEARPVLAWVVGNTYDHYLEHLQTIQRLAAAG